MKLHLIQVCASCVYLITLVSTQYIPGYPSNPGGNRVRTSFGEVVGAMHSIGDGKMVQSFIGIPYAASPVRANRFRVINVFLLSLTLSLILFFFIFFTHYQLSPPLLHLIVASLGSTTCGQMER